MRSCLALSVVLLAVAPAMAQDGTVTLYSKSHQAKIVEGGAHPASTCFFGGQYDLRNGMSSERNTLVADAWTFDDFEWSGGRVNTAFGNFIDIGIGRPVGGDVAVYAGMSEGHFGTLMGQATDVQDLTWEPVNLIDRREKRLVLHLGSQSFDLPAGTYHVGVRPVGIGLGQAFAGTTSGAEGVGSPLANGNSFLVSEQFGINAPTSWESELGPGNWDATFGLECGGDEYTLSVAGECPGAIRVSWQHARLGAKQAIIYSTGLGNAPLPAQCGSIPSGLASVTLLLPTFNTLGGEGTVQGRLAAPGCGQYIQLITYTRGPCLRSNVVQLP